MHGAYNVKLSRRYFNMFKMQCDESKYVLNTIKNLI